MVENVGTGVDRLHHADDDRAFDLVPSAIRLSLCSMKAPMISSLRGLGNLRDMRDLWELEGTRREKENASSERKTRRRKGLEKNEVAT